MKEVSYNNQISSFLLKVVSGPSEGFRKKT